MKRLFVALAIAAAAATMPARAHHPGAASEASLALSMLPVAVSVVAPAAILSGGVMLTVVAVQASAEGTVWILERASDGARATVTLSAAAAGGLSMVTGSAVVVTAFSAGWVLESAGRALAYIPNEIGRALLHNERITR